MINSPETLMLLILILPLIGSAGIAAADKNPNVREAVTFITSITVFILVVQLYRVFLMSDGNIGMQIVEIMPGLSLDLHLEPLGMIFALIAGFLWPITSLYGMGYMRGNNEKHQTRFFMFFPLSITATMGIAFAGNLLTLFIFYEVLTLSTFPLVTHKGTGNAMKAGRTYLGILLATSIGLLLPAIIWTWHVAGTTDFTAGGVLAGKLDGPLLTVLAFMFLYGIGKAAVMPAHRWLPAAMVAPTPVSALLHAVAVVKAGVFSVVKITVYIFGVGHLSEAPGAEWLLYAASFTVIMASIVALQQDNLKRRLAYSTISQLSYVVLATMILAPLSIIGAALHIAAHAFGKITLFFAAGSIYTSAHKTEISQLNGIGRRMPWTMGAFTIGALSMIGVPPAVGFISKWYMLLGAMQAEQWLAIGVIVISTLLNAAYFVPIIYVAFFKEEDPDEKLTHGEAPVAIVIALTVTAAMTLALFFLPQTFFELAQQVQVSSAQ